MSQDCSASILLAKSNNNPGGVKQARSLFHGSSKNGELGIGNGLVTIASLMLSCLLKVDLNYEIACCSDPRLL
ncbi:MAG: hypothetical protein F6K47_00440 [Symploca sp. SIO2E6]|nr:hypothetical protein [Symploca sp. SIO2E6]